MLNFMRQRKPGKIVLFVCAGSLLLMTAFVLNSVVLAQTPLRGWSYFIPVDPNIPRPTDWPERVTFVTRHLTFEQWHEKIVGTWKHMFACNGRPIIAARGSGVMLALGIDILSSLVVRIDANGSALQTSVRPLSQRFRLSFSPYDSLDVLDDRSHYHWRIEEKKNQEFLFLSDDYEPADDKKLFISLRWVQIEGTTEELIILDEPSHSDFSQTVCGGSEELQFLLVRAPEET